MPGPTNEGLFLRCLKPLDDIVSVKLLLRIWGPRFEFFVRLILVATFLDDSIRVATNFSEHTDQVVAAGQPLAEASPHLIYYAAAVVLAAGLLAQSLGSLCLVALIQPDVATKALIGWAIVQPVLYAQLTNFEFVAESLSLVGGLLIMRAHLSEQAKRDGRRVPVGGGTLCVPADPDSAPELAIARTQLLGRLLLPSVYLYRALTLLEITAADKVSEGIVVRCFMGADFVRWTLFEARIKQMVASHGAESWEAWEEQARQFLERGDDGEHDSQEPAPQPEAPAPELEALAPEPAEQPHLA